MLLCLYQFNSQIQSTDPKRVEEKFCLLIQPSGAILFGREYEALQYKVVNIHPNTAQAENVQINESGRGENSASFNLIPPTI